MFKLTTLFVGVLTIAGLSAHHGDDKADYKQVNGELTLKMLQTLTEDDNALFSPVLLTNSLLMLTNAASGDSRTELLKALNIKSEDDLQHINMDAKHIFDLREHLIEPKSKGEKKIMDKTEFDLLPKLMLRTDKDLKEQFKTLTKENYPIDVYKMPELNEDSKKTETKKINDWFLSKSLTGLMSRMLDDNDLTADIKMLLLNGASFKGAWKGKLFDAASTKEAEFKNHDGKMSSIDFMNRENAILRVNEYDDDNTVYIEVPFTEHDDGHEHKHGTKLVIMQSKTDASLDTVIDEITEQKLNERLRKTLSSPAKKVSKFSLPKMNFEKEYDLKEAMKELGIKQVFENTANFSQIVEGADLSKSELSLDQIGHRAIVQWTEEGDDSALPTESTADSAEIMLNKPFVFFILDDPKNDMKKVAKRHANHDHAGHDHAGHKHDEDKHDDAIIVFAGRVKTFSKDLTFAKKQE